MEEKKLVVFHIGMPKTGSTALQNFLEKNNEKLKQKGWFYPMRKSNYTIEQRITGNGFFLLYEDKVESSLDEMLEYTKQYNLIISREATWELNDARMEKLFKTILERYDNMKVIVYLRRQDEFIESYYNQRVKQPSKMSLTLTEFLKDLDLKERVFNYLHKLKILEKLVGDRLIVRRYTKDVITDFLSVIGVELENAEMPPVNRSNATLGSRLLEIRRILDSMDSFSFKHVDQVESMNLNNIISGRKDYYKIMSPEMRRDILKEYEADNEEIARRYLKDGKPLFEDMNVDIPYKEYRATSLEEEMIRVFFSFTANLERQMKNMAIKLLGNKKKLAYFGAGNICRKCLESGLYRPNIIIDDKGGREIDGIPVVNLDDMTNWRDYYFIITTGRFQRMNIGCLQEHGLTEIQDYVMYQDLDWNEN